MGNLKIYDPNLLLEQVNINKVPNINKIIKNSGIRVTSIPSIIMKNYRALVFIDSKGWDIYINRSLPKKVKKFIAAYMYSYVQLYYNREDVGEFSHPLPLSEEENFDKKAYRYALRLLMPENIFKSDVEKGLDNKKLAKKYKVSMFLAKERRELMERDKQKAKFKVIKGKKG